MISAITLLARWRELVRAGTPVTLALGGSGFVGFEVGWRGCCSYGRVCENEIDLVRFEAVGFSMWLRRCGFLAVRSARGKVCSDSHLFRGEYFPFILLDGHRNRSVSFYFYRKIPIAQKVRKIIDFSCAMTFAFL